MFDGKIVILRLQFYQFLSPLKKVDSLGHQHSPAAFNAYTVKPEYIDLAFAQILIILNSC